MCSFSLLGKHLKCDCADPPTPRPNEVANPVHLCCQRLSWPESQGCCVFSGLYGHVPETFSPDVSPTSMAGILTGCEVYWKKLSKESLYICERFRVGEGTLVCWRPNFPNIFTSICLNNYIVVVSFSVISGYETCNRYEVKNSMGQWIYFAAEENNDFTLNMYGALRSFTIKLFDSRNQPVMQLSRAFHCAICCCPCVCCLQELEVQAPPGTVIGYVKQKWHPCLPKFAIQNEARENVLKMAGPCVPCRCYSDIHFEVKALDEISTVGTISRQWGGWAREAATDASSFQVQFPMDLDVKMKAIILGSCFLLVCIKLVVGFYSLFALCFRRLDRRTFT
uniref:Phospholipid scramblase n=2 Tax=Anolis carolinensis TaxID=28377 RepID=A0A803TTB2_ANOCA